MSCAPMYSPVAPIALRVAAPCGLLNAQGPENAPVKQLIHRLARHLADHAGEQVIGRVRVDGLRAGLVSERHGKEMAQIVLRILRGILTVDVQRAFAKTDAVRQRMLNRHAAPGVRHICGQMLRKKVNQPGAEAQPALAKEQPDRRHRVDLGDGIAVVAAVAGHVLPEGNLAILPERQIVEIHAQRGGFLHNLCKVHVSSSSARVLAKNGGLPVRPPRGAETGQTPGIHRGLAAAW